MKKETKKVASVKESYAERRRPLDKKIPPHVRYNPDTLNKKEENEAEM